MAKKKKVTKKKPDVGLENLKSFANLGAKSKSIGNIPTGHFQLDFALHFGILPGTKDFSEMKDYDPAKPLGFPLGRVVEVFGDEGSGKSSICYKVVGNAQKLGYKCLWIDAEQSFSEGLAVVNNVDLENLYLSDDGAYAEAILDNILTAINSGIKVIVIDSVAAMIPQDIGEGDAGTVTMALLARKMAANLPKIVSAAGDNNALVIFINQTREKPGISFGNPETTPGGKTLPFLASIRLRFSKRNAADQSIFIEDPNEPDGKLYIGQYSGLSIKKNRFAKPLVDKNGKKMVLSVPIYFEQYFPDVDDIAFGAGRSLQVITVRKGVFYWDDIKEEGKENFLEALKKADKLPKLIEEVKESALEKDTIVPPELLLFDPKKAVPVRVQVESGGEEEEFALTRIGKSKKNKSKKSKP
jgi:protein RecA